MELPIPTPANAVHPNPDPARLLDKSIPGSSSSSPPMSGQRRVRARAPRARRKCYLKRPESSLLASARIQREKRKERDRSYWHWDRDSREKDKRPGSPLPCTHIPDPLRSPAGTSQGAGMGLMSSQTAQPRMSPDLSPAAPPHKRADGGPEPCTPLQGLRRPSKVGRKRKTRKGTGRSNSLGQS